MTLYLEPFLSALTFRQFWDLFTAFGYHITYDVSWGEGYTGGISWLYVSV